MLLNLCCFPSIVTKQASQSYLISSKDGSIDHKSSGNGSSQSSPKHVIALFSYTLSEAIYDATVFRWWELVSQLRLGLQSGLHHIQWVAGDPTGDPCRSSCNEHRPKAFLVALSTARMELFSCVLICPEIDTMGRRISENGNV